MGRRHRYMLLVFTLWLTTLGQWIWADDSAREKADIVRIDADVARAISQGDTQGCGPVSLLNMLKLGPEAYQKAYRELAGDTGEQAFQRLKADYCDTKGKNGKVRYSDRTGINDAQLTRLCEAVANDFQLGDIDTLYTVRNEKESDQDFALRINRAIRHSLSNNVPVIMSIDSYGERDGKWQKLTGHYMLFTGVQPTGPSNPNSFLVEYIDPVGAKHRQAFVYVGERNHPGAYAHYPDGDQWLEGNPYLCMASPSTELAQRLLGHTGRHEFFLTIIFGKLKVPNDSNASCN